MRVPIDRMLELQLDRANHITFNTPYNIDRTVSTSMNGI